MRRTKQKNIEHRREKRTAVGGVLLSTVLQLLSAAVLLYLRALRPPDWVGGVMLLLALAELGAIPFSFAALAQRMREIEKGELDDARKY